MSKVVATTPLAKSKVRLTIELSGKEQQQAMDEALKTLGQTVSLKGFRAGQAPGELIREQLGESRIVHKALDQLVNDSYSSALAEAGLKPLASPAISVEDALDPTGGKPLRYRAEVEIYPEVKVDGYQLIRVTPPEPIPVLESDVDGAVEEVRAGLAERKVKIGAAVSSDLIEIDFSGSENGVPLEKLQSKHHPISLGKTQLVAGFEAELLGKKAGDQFGFDLTYPNDFPAVDLAGKAVHFSVTVNRVESVLLPAVDDQLAAKIGFASLLEMRSRFSENLIKERAQEATNQLQGLVIEALLKATTVDLPQSLIDQQVGSLLDQLKAEIERMGGNFLAYLDHRKLTELEVKLELTPRAEQDVKIALALAWVAKDQGLTAESTDDQSAEHQLLGQALGQLVAIATSDKKPDNQTT